MRHPSPPLPPLSFIFSHLFISPGFPSQTVEKETQLGNVSWKLFSLVHIYILLLSHTQFRPNQSHTVKEKKYILISFHVDDDDNVRREKKVKWCGISLFFKDAFRAVDCKGTVGCRRFSYGLMRMSLTRCLQLCAFLQSFAIKPRCNGRSYGVMVAL